MICRLIAYVMMRQVLRTKGHYWLRQRVVRFDGSLLFIRYEPFWHDEWITDNGKAYNRPPWWRPFNILLHRWCPVDDKPEQMHDHPRWSVTLCLRGKMIEHTPWGDKVLTAGSIVVRSRKYIHSFSIPRGYGGKTWTLFMVGRRNYQQNAFVVIPHHLGTAHKSDAVDGVKVAPAPVDVRQLRRTLESVARCLERNDWGTAHDRVQDALALLPDGVEGLDRG